jgi:hypothetical protein
MLIHAHIEMKRFFNVGDRTVHIEQGAVWMLAHDRQFVGFRKSHQGVVIRFRRTELFDKLLWRQIMMIARARGIINILKEFVQLRGVSPG